MSQQMSIPQLQGHISNMRGKVQQCGASLQAARKAAEQAVSEFRSKESRRDSLEERVDDLRDRISDLHNEMSSLDDEDEASRDNLRSEIRGCSEMIRDYNSEIQDIEQEMSQLQRQIQVEQQRGQQYAGVLTQCREALKQIDQQLVGHIQERSQSGSRMDVLQRMNYASSARSPAGKLSQDVTLCEQERQKVASMQSEITRYLNDGVVVQAPEAQKKTYSGPGGAGRASTEAPVLPGLSDSSPGAEAPVLPGMSAAVDSGPSHIDTAKTVGAPVAAPSMVSMAPPGSGAQVDVSDIRQAAEANRGKWADIKKLFGVMKNPLALSLPEKCEKYKKISKKIKKSLNHEENKAVWEYTTEEEKFSYHTINRRMRDPSFQMKTEEDQAELDRRISSMKAAIDRCALPTQEIVYRGTKSYDEIFGQDFYGKYTPEQLIKKFTGAFYVAKAFTSTSYDYNVAMEKFSGDAILTVRVPKGAKGMTVDAISNYGTREHEIIFQANSVFQINEIVHEKGLYHITVTLCGTLP